MVKWALRYAERGIPVFPLRERGKLPLFPSAHPEGDPLRGKCRGECGKVGHGFYDATTDPEKIKTWWKENPKANIAGRPPADHLVLDLDTEGALHALDALGFTIPATSWATTSRGRHYWFRHDVADLSSKIGLLPDVDVRASDGYVVLPPSVHPSGVIYEWDTPPKEHSISEAPEWLLQKMAAPEPVKEKPDAPTVAVLQGVGEGSRDENLYSYACRLRGKAMDYAEAWELVQIAAARCSPPFPLDEARKCLDSAWKHPAGEPALEEAKNAQWEPDLISIRELMLQKYEPIRWLVKGLISEGLTVLGSAPKIGKSWLMLNTALSVSVGAQILGRYPTERGRVLYLDLEQSRRKTQERVNVLSEAAGVPGTEWRGVDFAHKWERLDKGGLSAMERYLRKHTDTRLVVIDVLAKVIGRKAKGSGTIYDDDYPLFSELKSLADDCGVAIVGIHHDRKPGSSGESGDEVDAFSGSRGITGVADALIFLSRKRGKAEGHLFATGRDIPDQRLPIRFDPVMMQWLIQGDDTFSNPQGEEASGERMAF